MSLGLGLPARSAITQGRWTGLGENVAADPGLFMIFSIEWYDGGKYNTVNIYLSPEFYAQSGSGSSFTRSPWLTFSEQPAELLGNALPNGMIVSSVWAGGGFGLFAPQNPDVQMDPSGFSPAIQALMDAENYYLNAVHSFSTVTGALAGNANQFQGQAGGAFAQLMQDFSQQAVYANGKMGIPSDSGSYSGLLTQAGEAAGTYLMAIWNAWANWSNQLTHTPLGAILQALINDGVVAGAPGNWGIRPGVNLRAVSNEVGDLTTDSAWQVIETHAKQLWLAEVASALDYNAIQAILALQDGYYAAFNKLNPLKAPPPTQIVSNNGPNGSLGPNFDMPNFSMPNFDMPNFSMPNFSMPNFNFPDTSGTVGGGAVGGPAGGTIGDFGGPNGSNPPFVASTGPGSNQPTFGTVGPPPQSALVVNPNMPQVTGTVGANSPGPVQQALDSNAGTQDALQSALTSGQVPPGSALAGDLNTALNDANQTQAALNQAAGAGNTNGSALQAALNDNAGTQAAINQALNSGQVPPGSPLANDLQAAQNSANQTQADLNQALAAGPPPSAAQTSATQAALGDNSQTQQALNQALMSGQVPPTSPLHSTIQSALTDAGKTQAAITQALKSGTGTTTASLDQALKDNQATQNALNQALNSGQVPTTGPLRADLNQALADTKQTGAALQQALAQQGVLTEPNVGALTSPVGVAGLGATGPGVGGTPLLTSTLGSPGGAAVQTVPVSSGAFVPAAQTAAAAGESPFPMYSPMAGGGMMGGQGMGQGQGQERERTTWLAEDEDVWGTDPDIGPEVIGRDRPDNEEPEEYDGYRERRETPVRKTPARRVPGR
jgi:hypothetical protein